MRVELKVCSSTFSCETDYSPNPSASTAESDKARNGLFERLLGVVVEQARDWLYDGRDAVDPEPGNVPRPGDYALAMERALKPVLAIEGAIEQSKRSDREIHCRLDERLFESLDAVASAQETMNEYAKRKGGAE